MSGLREQYRLLRDFWTQGFGRMVGICTVGMGIFLILGIGVGLVSPDVIETVLNFFLAGIEESGVIGEDGSISVFALLFNNWWAMLLSAVYGLIPFLFLPILSLATNSVLLGLFAALYLNSELGLLAYLAGILPHGVFELPALVLSIACGLYLCLNINRRILASPRKMPMVELFSGLLRVLLLLVAPLVVVAAFVECYITPLVLALFL